LDKEDNTDWLAVNQRGLDIEMTSAFLANSYYAHPVVGG
jgi:hypothetical protein